MLVSRDKRLIVVGGPTASGKTSLGIEIAQHFNTEILSADSRQFYAELNIGVARPSDEELATVKHHFIAHKSIHDYYSAGEFARDAMSVLSDLFKKYDVVVMVGGSGLFINAVLHGFHGDIKDDGTVRRQLDDIYKREGISALQKLLQDSDNEEYESIDLNNPQRIMRAIELVKLTGKTQSERTQEDLKARDFKTIEIAIDHPREVLYDRINHRVDLMMKAGLLDEVKSLINHRELNALKTVGYAELFDALDGTISMEEAVEKVKQNTRRYAKRQMTWFRNKSKTTWFKPEELGGVIEWLKAVD